MTVPARGPRPVAKAPRPPCGLDRHPARRRRSRPNPDADVAGYEIAWRDSTEPFWTHARRVGNVTDATIPGAGQDDNQVGVRAIDRDGNRSPLAYPLPEA